jgi:RNA polymerase sigma factor (TIGR02999 family)
MRQILVDHARRVQTTKRGGGVEHVDADLAPDAASSKAEEFLQLDEAIDKLAQLSDRKARVVELRYFGGFSLEEVAETLGVSVASVYREQRLAEAWLGRAMGPTQ